MSTRTSTPGLIIIGLGEMQVCTDPDATLITYALGSCLGVAVYDPVARVGGMLHAVLPRVQLDEERARTEPGVFVESGLPALFRACYAHGARKERLVVHLAGAGANTDPERDHFEIGRRNLLMARQLFWKNSILVTGQDVGGNAARTLSLRMDTGAALVRSGGSSIQL